MDTDKIYAESLVNEYSKKETSKVVALKKLDLKAKLPANIFVYSFGIVMTLVVGVGMCLSMKVIGDGSVGMLALGIVLGVLGFIGVGFNYPIYKKILAKSKEKYAADIIELANQISSENK